MKALRQLYVQVIIGIALGIGLGILAPAAAVKMKPLGDGFIALLRLLLAPIIFCTVVHGLASVQDMRKLGRLGIKSLIYFEVVSTIGLIFGLILVNVFKPGVGLHAANLAATAAAAGNIATTSALTGNPTLTGFLLSIIPTTLVDAFAKGDILQVLLVSILIGIALSLTSGPNSVILRFVAEGQAVLFRILGFIMVLAPIGAFGAMAAAVGANGSGALLSLMHLVVLFYVGCALFIFTTFGLISRAAGISIFNVLRMIKDEIFIVFGTSSSEVVFPRLVQKLEEAGCDEAIVGFVLPAGYSFNLDGTAMYLAVAVGFIAQATGTPFPLRQQLAILAVLMLTSKGGTTVGGAAFVKLAATLQSVRVLPLSGLGLLLGIDRLMSTALAVTNMIGNTVAVFAIAKSENAFDRVKFDAFLALREECFPGATAVQIAEEKPVPVARP